jgi:hypothetical protein
MYNIAMNLSLILAVIQTSGTGIPKGADVKVVGKIRPNTYTAIREYHTLPTIGELSAAKRQTFTGSVISLDFPQRGMVHVMNYRNGKRVVFDNPKSTTKENRVPLTKMLTTLPPKVDIRFAATNVASFDAKLPGEEKKLAGFTGTLTAHAKAKGEKGISIILENGKVFSSSWLKTPTNIR